MVHRTQTELLLDTIIFQKRNKAYGAFYIRQSYNAHLKTAIFFAGLSFSMAAMIPVAFDIFKVNDTAPVSPYVEKIITVDDIDIIVPSVPPPATQPKQLKADVSNTRFLPPKIVSNDTELKEELMPEKVTGIIGTEDRTVPDVLQDNTLPSTLPGDEVTIPVEEKIYLKAQEEPKFIGDYVSFMQQSIRYPAEAQRNNVSGRVIVQYLLNPDGSITDVEVLKGIGYGCDEEAVRVVKLMNGKWTPGKNNGYPVKLKTMVSILFQLNP